MEGFQKAWGWIIGAFIAGAVAVAAILHALSKDAASAAAIRADAIEKNAQRDLTRRQKNIDQLKKDLTGNAGNIARAEAGVAKKRAVLEKKFTGVGLSASEITERLGRLRL